MSEPAGPGAPSDPPGGAVEPAPLGTAGWRSAAASVRGTAHVRNGLPCQDASVRRLVTAASGERVLVAVAADGAGTAKRAEVGAALCCERILGEVESYLAAGGGVAAITRERAEVWVAGLRTAVEARAAEEELRGRDFAATLLAAVIGTDAATFFQVGDGAIVVPAPEPGDDYAWIFWPGNGEYENITFFATEPNALEHLEHATIARPIDEVALFTDGLQRLALHYQSRTAHAPFFRPMLQVLRAAADGDPDLVSRQLAAFISSPQVDERTDDDKTLILASRRRTTEPEAQPIG